MYSIKNAGMGIDISMSIIDDVDPIKEVKAFIDYVKPGLIDRICLYPYFPSE
jgi:hypothetical protein